MNRLLSSRLYHSFSHLNKPILDISTLENQLLNRAYAHVPQLGFSEKAIQVASTEMGLNAGTSKALFNFTSSVSNVKQQLVLFHLLKCRQDLQLFQQSEAFQTEFSAKSEFEKVKVLMNYRLSMNLPVLNHLSEALGEMVLPSNFSSSLQELHNLSDDITFYAGDRSNDFAWYSKRFSLSTAYVQSELFMLNDTSRGCKDTLKFAEDKLKEIESAAYVYNSVEEWLFFNAVSVVNIIKSQLARG